ncbi:MAG: hemolysin family protein [Tissierellia bacterium]|nr:hemolysin family protein [Tissierellia bacterium]
MNTWIYVIVIVLLIGSSAFFSSAETALMSANPLRLRRHASDGDASATRVLRLLERPQELISTILVGNNVVNIASSSLATVLFTKLLGVSGPFVSTVVMTIAVLIFGEVLPKSVAQQNPEALSQRVSRPITTLTVLLKPVVVVLTAITGWIFKLFLDDEGESPAITEEELKTMIEVSEEEGLIQQQERVYIDNVFDFSSATASDMMTPRTSISALDVNATPEEIEEMLSENRFSRIPLYEESIDHIVGILFVKDLVRHMMGEEPLELRQMMRKPYFIGESAVATRIFHELKSRKLTIAVVVDEYAGTSGIITMEDILEELVGTLGDEYDFDSEEIILLEAGAFLLDPELRIDEVNDYFHLDLSSEKSDSIGGFVIEQLDRIPKQGDVVSYGDLVFTVTEMEGLKMTHLKLDLKQHRKAN